MRKNKKSILSKILLLAAAGLMLYPSAANAWNSLRYSYLAGTYRDEFDSYSEDLTAAMIHAGMAYNSKLNDTNFMRPDEELEQMYDEILDPQETGMIGTVEAPGLFGEIPIYHSTEETVLQNGIGHMEGSSFPVYGEKTHCVLAGHTGLKHSRLFTDLGKLKKGDVFRIRILGLVAQYRIVDIQTVLPEDVDCIRLEEGKEFCSLVTCTPYGINSHRLVVKGERY